MLRTGGSYENRPFDRHFIHPAAEGYRHRTGTGGTIRSAIDGCRELQFLYYAPKGESWRIIEPYYLIFRVCLGLVQAAEGLPAVQAEPDGGAASVRANV